MKKLLLILLYLPMIGFGQDKSFELGLLFGGSFNSLNGDHEFTEKTLRPTGGFLAQYNFNNRFMQIYFRWNTVNFFGNCYKFI